MKEKNNGCKAECGRGYFLFFLNGKLNSRNELPLADNVFGLGVRWGFPALKPNSSNKL